MLKALTTHPFLMRRLHSLMGLWLVLFLLEHLLTNSQAALWIGEDGQGFVRFVNALHNLPYLPIVEAVLLGVPFLIHMVWGIRYALTAKPNSGKSDGSTPQIKTARNKAYSWQRITSWILLIGIVFHVGKFRFVNYPEIFSVGGKTSYLVPLHVDTGLYTVASRMHVTLYDTAAIAKTAEAAAARHEETVLVEAAEVLKNEGYTLTRGPISHSYNSHTGLILTAAEQYESAIAFAKTLEKYRLSPNQVVAEAPDFGTASLLTVRETFKSPLYVVFYTLFVLAACFHACNGFWTFLITWGLVLKASAQKTWIGLTTLLMLTLMFLGLAAIWGTYWINLKN